MSNQVERRILEHFTSPILISQESGTQGSAHHHASVCSGIVYLVVSWRSLLAKRSCVGTSSLVDALEQSVISGTTQT